MEISVVPHIHSHLFLCNRIFLPNIEILHILHDKDLGNGTDNNTWAHLGSDFKAKASAFHFLFY